MVFDLQTALILTQKCLSVGILIESVELLFTRDFFAAPGPIGLSSKIFTRVLFFRAAAALLFFLLSESNLVDLILVSSGLLFMMGSSIWLILKTRGPLCGGSDSMFFQVQLGLFVANVGNMFHDRLPFLASVGLAWIAAQSLLSYLIAGLSKSTQRSWRNGEALFFLLNTNSMYTLFSPARTFANTHARCSVFAWMLILFELSFITVLTAPPAAVLVILTAGAVFHGANALVFGLNRFLWAWIATYPAIFYFAVR